MENNSSSGNNNKGLQEVADDIKAAIATGELKTRPEAG